MPDLPDEDAANLVLALAVEPPELSLRERLGIEDDQIVDVVVQTLARLEIVEPVEISVLVTGDEGLHELNRQYRGQDKPTDVLSFPAQDAPLVSAPSDQLWQRPAEGMGAAGANGATPAGSPLAALGVTDEDLAFEDDLDDGLDDDEEPDDDLDELDDLEELEEEALDLGDIAISHEAVIRQAQQAGHSAAWEFAYLLVHGVLHLIGYDDETEAGHAAMVAHQEAILAGVNIPK